MPIGLDPARLDDDDGIEETLQKTMHSIMLAVSFYLTIQNYKELKRTSTLSSDPEEGCSTNKLPRKSHDQKALECFLCEKHDTKENLRHAMTM